MYVPSNEAQELNSDPIGQQNPRFSTVPLCQKKRVLCRHPSLGVEAFRAVKPTLKPTSNRPSFCIYFLNARGISPARRSWLALLRRTQTMIRDQHDQRSGFSCETCQFEPVESRPKRFSTLSTRRQSSHFTSSANLVLIYPKVRGIVRLRVLWHPDRRFAVVLPAFRVPSPRKRQQGRGGNSPTWCT